MQQQTEFGILEGLNRNVILPALAWQSRSFRIYVFNSDDMLQLERFDSQVSIDQFFPHVLRNIQLYHGDSNYSHKE